MTKSKKFFKKNNGIYNPKRRGNDRSAQGEIERIAQKKKVRI